MDVPYRSSGASSRQHYALVRKVEEALSIQDADRCISDEVEAVRGQISDPRLTLRRCRELLILLLYCHSAVTSPVLRLDTLYFAIPHALNLAEAGVNVRDKRLGYLFCTEIMPPDHELQLMLVNTLRKDLESPSTDRICLALDNLISASIDDLIMIPAVQPRLHDLLTHPSDHVQRRVLLAFRALSRHDHGIMQTLTYTLVKRLGDEDANISAAAFLAATAHGQSDEVLQRVNNVFASSPHHRSRYWLLVALRSLQVIGLRDIHLHAVTNIIRVAATHKDYAILFQACLLLRFFPYQSQDPSSVSLIRATVQDIRGLLSSDKPYNQYVFLSCIACIDTRYWAGTPGSAAILEEREVGRFMRLLDSADSLIRRKAITILNNVDPAIVSTYYEQSVENVPDVLTYADKLEYTCRLLEVLEIQYAQDGEGYARQILKLFGKLDGPGSRILEVAVETILGCIRDNVPMFKMASSTVMIGYMLDGNDVGPTLMVIVIALATEYCGDLSFPAGEILSGLATRLLSLPASIQDVCLIAMLRISIECEEVQDVRTVVEHLAGISKQYLRQRCEEFLQSSRDRTRLVKILSTAKSYSLPHVLEALSNGQAEGKASSTAASPKSPGSPSLSGSKLRYAAYDAPTVPKPRTNPRRPSVARSETDSLDSVMSRTMTPGELALATKDLEAMSLLPTRTQRAFTEELSPSQATKVDLIAFDAPFLSDPDSSGLPVISDKEQFEVLWDSPDGVASRGWFGASVDQLLERLESVKELDQAEVKTIAMEEEPFKGELKVLIGQDAALRVKPNEDEDDGCLWRLRCRNIQLRVGIKRAFSEDF